MMRISSIRFLVHEVVVAVQKGAPWLVLISRARLHEFNCILGIVIHYS